MLIVPIFVIHNVRELRVYDITVTDKVQTVADKVHLVSMRLQYASCQQ